MTQVDVLILGASGYGGGELLRWLSNHPAVASLRGTARSHAGKPFHAQHPNLRGLVDAAGAAHGVVGAEDEGATHGPQVRILQDGLHAVLAHDAIAGLGHDDIHAMGG